MDGVAQTNIFADSGYVGVGTINPTALLEIHQEDNPNSDVGLVISEPNNTQTIRLHLADNVNGEYGYFYLGGTTSLRGNGQPSFFDGSLGLGTTNLNGYKLAVNGNIHAKEVKVDLVGWPDYVLKKGYNLPTLEEVEMHIKEKGHLINIPSAKEVEENGIELGEMNRLLLEKIEELTLYTIQQQRELEEQKEENLKLKNRLEILEKNIEPKENE